MFVGIFFPNFVEGTMENRNNKGGLHVTLAYKPTPEKLAQYTIGQKVEVRIVGYGKDDENEGLLVEFDGIPYYGAKNKHITLSCSKNGKPVNTGYLNFSAEALEEFRKTHDVPDTVIGVIDTYK